MRVACSCAVALHAFATRGVAPLTSECFDFYPKLGAPRHSMNTSTLNPPASTKRKWCPDVSGVDGTFSREHAAAVVTVLAIHLGHVYMPGAWSPAGIARRGGREAEKGALQRSRASDSFQAPKGRRKGTPR